MSSGKLSIDLLGTPAEFEKIVLNAITEAFGKALDKSIETIKEKTKKLVYKNIYDCNEMEAISEGSLRLELGLSSGQAGSASHNIAEAVIQSISVQKQKASKKSAGGLSLNIQPSSFSNILGVPDSSVSYFSKHYRRGVELEWLDWLLNRGDEIIVSKFSFVPSGKGRLGGGRMEKGGSWRISPQYAGTSEDNFITRALGESSQEEIASIIEKEIKKHWK